MTLRDGGELLELRQLGEADDAEVRLVHAQEERRLGPNGALVVLRARAVRRADLDEPRARAREHVGDAEAVADLDQLAARDDHLAALGERAEREQHRGGVVVDDERSLGAGQPAQDRRDVILPRAARAVAQVELEVRVAARDVDHLCERLLGERRAAEIRVHDHAGRVQDAPEVRRAHRAELVVQALREVAGIGARADLLPRAVEHRAARRRPRADRRSPRTSSSTDGRSRSCILERLLTSSAEQLARRCQSRGPPLSPLARDRRARALGDRLCLHLRATGVPRPRLRRPRREAALLRLAARATAGRGRSARPASASAHDESRWNMSAIHWRDLSALRIAARPAGVDPQSLRVIEAARLLPGPRERPFLLVGGRDAHGRTCIGAAAGRRGAAVLLPRTAPRPHRDRPRRAAARLRARGVADLRQRRRQRGRDAATITTAGATNTVVRGHEAHGHAGRAVPVLRPHHLRAHLGDDHVVPRPARSVERAHRLLRRARQARLAPASLHEARRLRRAWFAAPRNGRARARAPRAASR